MEIFRQFVFAAFRWRYQFYQLSDFSLFLNLARMKEREENSNDTTVQRDR